MDSAAAATTGEGLVGPVEALELFQRIATTVVALGLGLFAFLGMRKLVFYLTWRSFRDGPYVLGQHQWRPGNLAGPHWCNICASIVYGIRSYVVTCDICGMFAHAQCAATTMRMGGASAVDPLGRGHHQCKTAAITVVAAAAAAPEPKDEAEAADDPEGDGDGSQTDDPTATTDAMLVEHVWIKGNIDPMDTCAVCGLFCGSILALSGLKCAWCHRRVHENCFRQQLDAQQQQEARHHGHHHHHHRHHILRHCDLGRLANLILPPTAVRVRPPPARTPRGSGPPSTSQRALSSVRSAVSRMSGLRLRRPGSLTPADANPKALLVQLANGSPSASPRRSSSSSSSSAAAAHSGFASSPPPSPTSSTATTATSTSSDGLLPPLLHLTTPPPSSSRPTSPTAAVAATAAAMSGWGPSSSSSSSSWTSSESLAFEIVPPKDISPLLVFINSRSGGQLGLHVLRQIRRWLNPIQIYDLSHQSPVAPLIQFKDIPRLRILVCGGDGTVGWVLGALDEIGAARQPPIAILPLGTGNDLARVLGWGSGFSTKDVGDILAEVEAAHVSLLDRWRVEIDGKKRGVLNNYLGVGVDAQVALEFHEQRERSPGLFMSQFVNKLWYSQFGAKNFLVRTCAGLPSKMTLECDGKLIALPEGTEGVILLNINSYGGGSTLWHEDSDSEDDELDEISASETDDGSLSDGEGPIQRVGASSPHDGFLDVVAVYGTLHLGQMQVGLSKAVRLCQARHVRIKLNETLPVQIDGEPWQQEPCELDISFHQQAFMLSRTVQERDFVTRRVGEVLDWAETTGVISSRQRDVLLAEIARRVADSENGTSRSSLLGAPPS